MVLLNYVKIGSRIRSRRKILSLTQKQLGLKVNLSEGSVSKYESGKVEDATTSKLNEFADALEVDIAWLLGAEKNNECDNQSFHLSNDEQKLITSWRKLSHDNQMKVLGIVELKLDEEAAAREEYVSQAKRA